MELRDIEGYDGKYKVNNTGEVYSFPLNGNIKKLKPGVNSAGYYNVCLYKNGKAKSHTVHRLVAMCFLRNINNLPEINHKNCNKLDNNVSNLEWTDRLNNMKHAFANNLRSSLKGEKNGRCIFSEAIIREVKQLLKNGASSKEIIQKYPTLPFTKDNISNIKQGRIWGWLEV